MVLAVLARVDVYQLLAQWNVALEDAVLAGPDRELFRRHTSRRRWEFVAGRLAVKLAYACAFNRCELTQITVESLRLGRIVVGEASQGIRLPASLSHHGRWAIGVIAVSEEILLGVDVIDLTLPPLSLAGFHALELSSACTVVSLAQSWVMKEAAGKVSGIGLNYNPAAILHYRSQHMTWLAMPPAYDVVRLADIAYGTSGTCTLGIALSEFNSATSPTI